ncbi:MAG: DNA cytosine methyltransferase [Candidatus Aenigmatarchaeota archaeon]
MEKPQVVIIENVPPFKKFLPYFEKFIPKPYKLVHKNVYNYLDYGCNWNRKRLFIILAQNNLDIDMSRYIEPSRTSYEILPYTIPFIEYKTTQSVLKRYYNDKSFKSCIYCKQFLPSFGSNSYIFHESHGLLHPLQIAQLLELPLDFTHLSLPQMRYALANAIHPKFMSKIINMVERVI